MIRELLTIPSAIFFLFLSVLVGIEILSFGYGFRTLPFIAILIGVWIWVVSFVLEGLRRDLSRKRKQLGLCVKCGYDHYVVSYVVIVPLWIPTVLFAAMFWWSFLPRRRRRKRKKLGLCVKCGYDLRGLVEQLCPECGEAFETT